MREQDAQARVREPDCGRIRDDLKAYLDGELAPLRRGVVSRHLASCAACRAEVTEMARITQELAREDGETLDPALRGSMVEAMESAAGRASPTRQPRRRLKPLEAALLTAIAVVVIAIFFPVFAGVREKARNPSPPSAMPSVAPAAPFALKEDRAFSVQGVAPDRNPASPTGPVLMNRSVPQDGTDLGAGDASLGRKVHKSATITVQVADPEASGEKIEDAVASAGGFVTSSSLNTDPSGSKTASLVIKAPLPQFEGTLTQIARLGSVTAKSVTGEDITEQVSDADQRQAVLQQDMDQAQEQLRKKGAKASWDLQEDARDLRIQLAQARARLKLLKSLAALSEIDVTLSQPPKAAPPVQTGFLSDLGVSGRSAMESGLGSLGALIGLVFSILAYAPLWLPAWLVGRWFWRRYRQQAA